MKERVKTIIWAALISISVAAITWMIHDCNGCMGAAYNPRDCETCENVQITGKDGEKK